MTDTQLIGAAGEHLVLSRLLARGFLAAHRPAGRRSCQAASSAKQAVRDASSLGTIRKLSHKALRCNVLLKSFSIIRKPDPVDSCFVG